MDSRQLLQDIRARSIDFVPGKKVISIAPGEWTSLHEGKGYEPIGYRDFQMGDDPRRINLPATTMRGVPTIVERVALRDFKIMVVIDNSASLMVREKKYIQMGAAALLLYSAWKCETTFGLAVRSDQGVSSFGMGIGSKHFYHSYRRLWDTLTKDKTVYLKGAKNIALGKCLPSNAMLLYCSDFLDAQGYLIDLYALKRKVERYDFIPIIIQDEFDYSFPTISHGTFITISNPETHEYDEVWISPQIANEIRNAHQTRFDELTSTLGAPGLRSLHLASPVVQVSAELISKFFRKRGGRSG